MLIVSDDKHSNSHGFFNKFISKGGRLYGINMMPVER